MLGASIQATVGDASTVVGSLRRGDDSPGRFLTSVAEAHVGGVAVDWRAVHGDAGPDGTERPDGSYGPVDLPTYAFDHERFWLLPDATGPAPATDAWRYRVGWQETTESLNSADLDGRWLLLVPAAPDGPQAGHAWCDAAAGALAGHGAPPHTVTVPVGDPARGGHRRTRRPRRPARFRRLRGSALAAGARGGPWTPGPRRPSSCCANWRRRTPRPPSGWQTRGAVGTGADDPVTCPAGAQVWGLGQAAALERGARHTGLVDLSQEPTEAQQDLLSCGR